MTAIANDTRIDFEESYLRLREKEERIYADDEVATLPLVSPEHRYYKEWQLRKESMEKLIHYLERKEIPLRILEIGCGNGWLSHRLASIRGSRITGLDVNRRELEQARQVFNFDTNLHFISGPITSLKDLDIKFDIILFAASIQYFQSVPAIIHSALDLLMHNGEIHILDSHFYKPGNAQAAKERSSGYFQRIGFPEMADHYFHHEEDSLKQFNSRCLYRPSFFTNIFSSRKNPFPWYCIKNNEP